MRAAGGSIWARGNPYNQIQPEHLPPSTFAVILAALTTILKRFLKGGGNPKQRLLALWAIVMVLMCCFTFGVGRWSSASSGISLAPSSDTSSSQGNGASCTTRADNHSSSGPNPFRGGTPGRVVSIWKDDIALQGKDAPDLYLEDKPVPVHWLNCISRMFRLDEDGNAVIPPNELVNPIPLLVTIVMTDISYLPRFLCSIDIPVRYWFLTLSGNVKESVEAINMIENAFNHTGRLILRREKINKGFAGSMNMGLRWGMNMKSEEEVPWFFVCNIDTAFGGKVLEKLAAAVYAQTAKDAPMLASLREEVRMEEAMIENHNLTWYNQYVPSGRPLQILREGYPGVPEEVHTAPLLPDRIRYMYNHINDPKEDYTKRYFKDHIGLFYPVSSALPASAVTRLLVATVGYMDENYHPIYMEDIDWRWRAFSFGFKEKFVAELMERYPHNPYFWHHNGANMVYQKSLHPQDTEDNAPRWAYQMSLFRKRRVYELAKTGFRNFGDVWTDRPVNASRHYRYFNVPYFPSDVYVTDANHKRCFYERKFDYSSQEWVRPPVCDYRCDVVKEAGILGTKQVRELDCVTGGDENGQF